MPEAIPDPVTAYLAAVQERYDGAAAHKNLHGWAREWEERGGGSEYEWMARSLIDIPRLRAAVEEALGRAAQWDVLATRINGAVAATFAAGSHEDLASGRALGFAEAAEALRTGIAEALLGEDA